MLQSKIEFIHPFRLNGKRQEFRLEDVGAKEYPFEDTIGKYRLQEVGQMSAGGIRGRATMVFEIEGVSPRPGMQWKVGDDEVKRMASEGRLVMQGDKPFFLFRPEHEDESTYSPFWSHFFDKDLYGTAESGLNELGRQLGFGRAIETVKPTSLIRKLLFHASGEDDLILDYFAGSGTTGHAVINLNREDGGKRKYILVEMGSNFDTVLLPRLKKVIYSDIWQDGKPVSRQGSSHMFKYLRLESYEDILNNLVFSRAPAQQSLLDSRAAVKEEYMLGYLLDLESRGSPSLLNVERFADPFHYTLQITRDDVTTTQTVDLVETFNYLIGLRVEHMAAREHRTADFITDAHGRLVVKDGRTRPCQEGEGWTFRRVQGRSPGDERVLILWRTLTGDADRDNAILDAYFARLRLNPRDREFDVIYVNGDNTLENVRTENEAWKVRLIEAEFHRLMWDVEDV